MREIFSYTCKSKEDKRFGRKRKERNLTSELSIIKYKTYKNHHEIMRVDRILNMIQCCGTAAKVPRGKVTLHTTLPWGVQLVVESPPEKEFSALKYKSRALTLSHPHSEVSSEE